MNRFLTWLALGAWGAVAFYGAFWLSFPSKAVSDRLSYEVSTRSGGAWELSVGSVAPWWYGLSAKQVVVSSVDKLSKDAAPTPIFFADAAGVRVSPWSLLKLSPAPLLMGYIGMDSASLDFALRGAMRDGALALRSVKLDASNIPVLDMLGLMGVGGDGGTTASGGVDVSVDLQLPNGLGKADGEISLKGNQIQIEKVSSTLIGWNEMEINTPIEDLSVQMAVEGGEATITDGVLSSPLVNAKLSGTIALEDNPGRSKLDVGAVVELGEWEGTPLSSFRAPLEGALRSARFADGSYHYKVEGLLGHLSFGDFRPERDSSSRALTRTPTNLGSVTSTPMPSEGRVPNPPPTPPPSINDGVAPVEEEPEVDPNAELPENPEDAAPEDLPLHEEDPAPPEN
jgi:type II secretion system protein N